MITIDFLGALPAPTYRCSCIKCGYQAETEGHCIDFRCPVCGGQMRRADRPGPGQELSVSLGQTATVYNCSCIKCGYQAETEGHCIDFRCPVCGGQMRRAERPGPGQERSISLGQYTPYARDIQYRRWRASQAAFERDAAARRRRPKAQALPRLRAATPPAMPPVMDIEAEQRRAAAGEETRRRLSAMLSPVASRGSSRARLAQREYERRRLERERQAAITELSRQAQLYRVPFREASRRVFGEDPAQMGYHALVSARLAPKAPQVPIHRQTAVITPIPAPTVTSAEAPLMTPPLKPPPGLPELSHRLVEARARLGV